MTASPETPSRFVSLLREQVRHEFNASQQYIAIAVYYDAQTLPIIALTAAALVSERDEALAAGMNDFLTKPVDARRLRKTLARHLRRPAPSAPG